METPDRTGRDRRRAAGGAAALMLMALLLWAGLFADGRWRGWWFVLGGLLLLAVIRDLAMGRRKTPDAP